MTTHISLMLAVEDASDAAGWYKRALGATELWSLGSVIGLRIHEAPLFLHEPTDTGFVSPAARGTTTVRVEVFCDDPDTFIRRAVEAGADSSVDMIRDHQGPVGSPPAGRFSRSLRSRLAGRGYVASRTVPESRWTHAVVRPGS
jgi:PhnB protein